MQLQLNILEAMLYCPYKAWQLSKLEALEYSTPNPVVLLASQINQQLAPSEKISAKLQKQAEALLAETTELLGKEQPPNFYKIAHCAECKFKNDCHQKLIERDCISLLPGMSLKSVLKYHNKGITTITQLSYLFKPRRRRTPNPQSSYLWELKALAIREQKTFVIQPPVLNPNPVAIYIDFEGTKDEQHIYLLGGLILKNEEEPEAFYYWSDNRDDEQANFNQLFKLLIQYPDAEIYHYGSYESKALKQAVKKWPRSFKQWPAIEKRMVNLLGYLRTHVYPPTYSNGLKEVGVF